MLARHSPIIFVLFALLAMLGTGPARASTYPRVVVSIAPLHSLVAAVMQGAGIPTLLLDGSESPHSFSLRPSEARMLSRADILFWIGPALELPLARVLGKLGPGQQLAMLDAEDLTLLPNRHLPPGHDDQDAAETAHGEAHDHQDVDPHIWLSPANAIVMAQAIADRLAGLDPPRSGIYRANAIRLQRELQALDAELAEQLASVRGDYVVLHDAYQYLELRYGLHALAAVTTHAERQPGAARLRALRRLIVEHDVRCLFSEPAFPSRLVDLLREGPPLRHAVLDPLGADITPGPGAYADMLRAIARTLTDCLQGDLQE